MQSSNSDQPMDSARDHEPGFQAELFEVTLQGKTRTLSPDLKELILSIINASLKLNAARANGRPCSEQAGMENDSDCAAAKWRA